jgi:outer membrane protein
MMRSIVISGRSKVESPSAKRQPFPSLVVTILSFTPLFAQSPPASPNRPWHSPEERILAEEGKRCLQIAFLPPSGKAYSLAELIDFAESHNRETRVSWGNAIARGEALGIARSELSPLLSAAVISGVQRDEVPFGSQFYRQTVPAFQASLDLSHTIFDFGARRGRIDLERGWLPAANFAFNDLHRNLIFQVQQAYYRLLHASGQEAAARASLATSEQVQQAADWQPSG